MALKIKVTRMFPYDGEKTKAFFGVKCSIAGYDFGFNDLTLVESKSTGLFVGFPSRPGKTEGEFFDFCYTNKKARAEIEKAATAEYKKRLKENAAAKE